MSASAAWLAAAGADARRMVGAVSTPVADPSVRTEERTRDDLPWLVIVWDDPVNLMSYVVLVLRRVLGLDGATAERLMLQVHHEGRAIVAREPREQAEHHVAQLHGYGLQATLERSD